MLTAVVGAVAAIRLDGPGRATASVRHGPAAIHLPGEHWVAGWGASPQAPIASNLSARGFADQTVRQIVVSSVGGAMVRVRLSNAFGAAPVRIAAAVDRRPAPGRRTDPGHAARAVVRGAGVGRHPGWRRRRLRSRRPARPPGRLIWR